MGLIHVQQIKSHLRSTFDGLIDLSDYAGKPAAEQEAAFLTRAVAAFSVMHLAGASAPDAAQAVTDGGQDNGVDAVFFDEQERILYVVQSKWQHEGRGSVERGDVQKFITGFKDLVNARFDRFNAKMQTQRPTVEKAINSADSRFVLVLAYNGQESLAVEQNRDLDDVLQEMNDPTDILRRQILKQADLHRIIASGAKGTPINLDVIIREWGQTREPYVSFYGQVAASEVAGWYAHHPRLFAPNIRTFLGSTEVNQGLTETLRNGPENFWYFNNGITVLCGAVRKKAVGGNSRESGYFECSDVAIVNGAQTVGAIAAASGNHPEAVAKATVLVRFISLENCPEDFAAQVTRATNTQNRIERRDFVAPDPEQERIQTELHLERIQYAYKSGDRVADLACGFDLTEATAAQACSHADVALAVQAKREISKLWEDITRAPYKALFNSSVVGTHLWYKVRILRKIDRILLTAHRIRTGRDSMFPVHGNRLIAHQAFRRLANRGMEKPNGYEFAEVEKQVIVVTREALDDVVRAVNDLFPDSYLAVLFKNLSKCRQVVKRIAEYADGS